MLLMLSFNVMLLMLSFIVMLLMLSFIVMLLMLSFIVMLLMSSFIVMLLMLSFIMLFPRYVWRWLAVSCGCKAGSHPLSHIRTWLATGCCGMAISWVACRSVSHGLHYIFSPNMRHILMYFIGSLYNGMFFLVQKILLTRHLVVSM